ncbi:hypothetical protein ACCS96_46425, partial [Rhizobium ruizarguesonis]
MIEVFRVLAEGVSSSAPLPIVSPLPSARTMKRVTNGWVSQIAFNRSASFADSIIVVMSVLQAPFEDHAALSFVVQSGD